MEHLAGMSIGKAIQHLLNLARPPLLVIHVIISAQHGRHSAQSGPPEASRIDVINEKDVGIVASNGSCLWQYRVPSYSGTL